MIKPKWQIIWVDTTDGLLSLVEEAKTQEYLPVDTETVGWQTGNEKLALIQIGIPTLKKAYLIDPFKLEWVEILKEILLPVSPAKVAHNASFEDRQFGRHNIKMKGIRDTLQMSRNLRPDLPNHQLKTCCQYILGVQVGKEEQTSDWSIRPLSEDQINYAALDVEVLDELYSALKELEQKLMVPSDATIYDLMKELQQISKEKLELTQKIAPQLSFLEQRYEKIKEAVKQTLINGAPAYEGEFGQASVKSIIQTEVNTQKVKDLFPEIAPIVIAEKVERKRLLDVMQEFGIDKKRLEEVLDPSNSYYRLNLEVEI